jgi:hypothetical protein
MVSVSYTCPYLGAVCVRNYGATNLVPTQKGQPLLSSKRGPHFQTHKRSWNEHKLGHIFRRGPKQGTTVLARANSNLMKCTEPCLCVAYNS